MRLKSIPDFVRIVILFAVYYITARVGLMFDAVSGLATAVWPPTGISLVALCLFGYRLWPGIAAGAFVANLTAGAPVLSAIGIAGGNTAEALVGAYLLQRIGFRNSLDRPKDVIGLAVLAAGFSTLISATIGVGSAWLGGKVLTHQIDDAWLTWWLGDAAGDLVVAPVLFVWFARPLGEMPAWRIGEGAALLACVVTAGLVVFGEGSDPTSHYFPYMLFPLVIWASVRLGQHGAVTATILLTAIAIARTAHGVGPFVRETPSEGLLMCQAFAVVAELTALLLATNVSERKAAADELLTARRELETKVARRTEELRQMNRAFEGAQQIAHVGSWEWDVAANVLRWSDELYRIYGLKPREFAATFQAFLARVHPEDRDRVKCRVERAMQDQQPFEFDERIVRPDGTERVLHSRGDVVTDAAGKPIRLMGTCQDITERRETEQKLWQAERLAAIGETVAGLAHESRNALQRSQACLEMLARKVKDQPDALDLLARLQQAQDHLHHLYEEVRGYAAPITLSRESCDLEEILQEMWTHLGAFRNGKQTRLSFNSSASARHCEVDPVAFGQVFRNILENALQACSDRTEIDVRCSESELGGRPAVRIAVRDNGPGLTAEQRERIFEPFFTTKTQGTGLGMAIAKRVVEAHGGSIAVGEDTGAGAGAEILVTIPRGRT